MAVTGPWRCLSVGLHDDAGRSRKGEPLLGPGRCSYHTPRDIFEHVALSRFDWVDCCLRVRKGEESMKCYKWPSLLALASAVVPLASAVAGPKPLQTDCRTVEVIIPNVTHGQVLAAITHRYRQSGDSVLVTVPDTTESCNARCSLIAETKEELRSNCRALCGEANRNQLKAASRGPVDIVFVERPIAADQSAALHAESPLSPKLEVARLQLIVSDARSGVRVQAIAGMVAFPRTDEEVVMDYSIPGREGLKSGLERIADSIAGKKRSSPPMSDAERAAAVKSAIEQLEAGHESAPYTYAFEDSVDQVTRAQVASIRKVVERSYALRLDGALERNVAVIQNVDVQTDTVSIRSLMGPTERKGLCAFPRTVRLQSTRTGWFVCGVEHVVC